MAPGASGEVAAVTWIPSIRSWTLLLAFTAGATSLRAQVFTVGEKTATADLRADFTPTHVELPDKAMSVRGRRDLFRNLEAEQGFAHRVLPLGSILTLTANGTMTPKDEAYRQMVYQKGQSAALGDRVMITALEVKGDRILIDLNGGPYVKHRFIRHLSIGVGGAQTGMPNDGQLATGCRIALVFEGGVPEVSAPEVKALLEPVVDFGVKTGVEAYADTLPAPIKSAIASHELLVGMDHRMVLAALGQPESKIREETSEGKYEEWIYGHQPKPVRFVRFVGDRVSLIKIAALGKPIETRDQDEMAGYFPPLKTRTVKVGQSAAMSGDMEEKSAPPSLQMPGEAVAPGASDHSEKKVQFPEEHKAQPGVQVPAQPPSEKLLSSSVR